MNIEDIEEIYKNETEDAGKEFVEGIKNKKDLKELEKNYKEKLKNSREKYYNSISDYINTQKFLSKKVKKQKNKKEKQEYLDVKPGDFELNIFQRTKFKLSLLYFRLRFFIGNKIKKRTPVSITYAFFNIKLKIKRFSTQVSNYFDDSKNYLVELFKKNLEKIKEVLKKYHQKIISLLKLILSKFSKKKKSEENKDNSEEKEKESEDNSSKTSE